MQLETILKSLGIGVILVREDYRSDARSIEILRGHEFRTGGGSWLRAFKIIGKHENRCWRMR